MNQKIMQKKLTLYIITNPPKNKNIRIMKEKYLNKLFSIATKKLISPLNRKYEVNYNKNSSKLEITNFSSK